VLPRRLFSTCWRPTIRP